MNVVEELQEVIRALPEEAQNRLLTYARALADAPRALPDGGSPEHLLVWANSVSPDVADALAAGAADSERFDLGE